MIESLGPDPSGALKGIINGLKNFSLIPALILIGILVVTGIIVNFKFHDKLKDFMKIALSILVGFALALIAVFLFFQITRLKVKDEINTNFWLWVGFSGVAVLAAVVCSLVKVFKEKFFKLTAIISAVVVAAYAIVLLCIYPTSDILGSKALYIILSVALVLGIILAAIFTDRKKGTVNNTKSLTYAGICIAIAYALSYIKFFDGPQGSSITLVSMLPIMLYAYLFGAKKGVIAGLVYGILQCLQDPQIYEPLQVMLDYPIAFSALGLAGVFKDKKFLKGKKILEFALGIVVAGVGRYCAHLLSGYFIFGLWVEDIDPLLNSFVYNLPVLVDAAIDLVAGVLLYSSKSMSTYLSSINPSVEAVAVDDEVVADDVNNDVDEVKNDK